MDEKPPKNGDIPIMDVDFFGDSKSMSCRYNSSREEWVPIEEITPQITVCKPLSKPLSPSARTVLEMKNINNQQNIKLQLEKKNIQKRIEIRNHATMKQHDDCNKYPEGIGCNLMGGRRRTTLRKRTKRSRARRTTKRRRTRRTHRTRRTRRRK